VPPEKGPEIGASNVVSHALEPSPSPSFQRVAPLLPSRALSSLHDPRNPGEFTRRHSFRLFFAVLKHVFHKFLPCFRTLQSPPKRCPVASVALVYPFDIPNRCFFPACLSFPFSTRSSLSRRTQNYRVSLLAAIAYLLPQPLLLASSVFFILVRRSALC